jgi:putative membrane protein
VLEQWREEPVDGEDITQPYGGKMQSKTVWLAATMLSTVMTSASFAADEATFLQDAIQGSLAEVQMGELAQQKGSSEDVKTFGQTLVTDHSKSIEEASALAQSMSLEVPAEPKAEARQEYEKLQGLKGAEFDREFAEHMVMDHQKEIEKFEEQAQGGSDEVARFAKQTLPVLNTHLDLAKKIEAQQK